jgi:hypothetical protein
MLNMDVNDVVISNELFRRFISLEKIIHVLCIEKFNYEKIQMITNYKKKVK